MSVVCVYVCGCISGKAFSLIIKSSYYMNHGIYNWEINAILNWHSVSFQRIGYFIYSCYSYITLLHVTVEHFIHV